jgi:hypothetical protein
MGAFVRDNGVASRRLDYQNISCEGAVALAGALEVNKSITSLK